MTPNELGAYWKTRHGMLIEQWNDADEETKKHWAEYYAHTRSCEKCHGRFQVEDKASQATMCPCCQSMYDAELRKLAVKQVDLEEAVEAERQRRRTAK